MYKRLTTYLIASISCLLSVQAQTSFLFDNNMAVFYPADFDSTQTLPSFAIQPDLLYQADVPADWEIRPVFTTNENGKTMVEILYDSNTDLYGTGLVTGKQRRNGTSIEVWNKDNYGYYTPNCLYQSHPWIMGIRPDGKTFGIIADNTWRSYIDLSDTIRITSEGPSFRVIVIERDDPYEMMAALGQLTGKVNLPPIWALGFHQSRYNPTYTPEEIIEKAKEFRKRQIPCDVFWVDIDYMDGKRIFTYDANGFFTPGGINSPIALNDSLHNMQYKVGYITDPGVKIDDQYSVYLQGCEGDHWVKNAERNDYEGEVWPGLCHFPDFTRPETRSWWAELYGNFYKQQEMDGAWNDMNEPGVFNTPEWTMLTDNWHRGGGGLSEGPHMRYHNLYGSLMSQASYEGLKNAMPQQRPFLLSRANHLGAQRYCATWTGDNLGTWEHMILSVPMCITLGLSGQPFGGPDVGGYGLDVTPELLAHWMALSAYYPFSRNHTSACSQEPWVFGEKVEAVSRTALNRRYMLLPYLYTLFQESSTNGMPVMRPLFFADPTDADLRTEEQAFLVGSDLLVIPRWAHDVVLPKGDWDLLRPEEEEDDGYQPLLALRPGSILPYLGHTIQSTENYTPDSLTLFVNPLSDGSAQGNMYNDAGNGFEYQNGAYETIGFTCSEYNADSLVIDVTHTGGNMDKTRFYRVAITGGDKLQYTQWTDEKRIFVQKITDDSNNLEIPNIGVIFVTGTFNNWDTDQYLMTQQTDKNSLISDMIRIEKGDHRLKFTNSVNWSGSDWGGTTGLSGVAQVTTGGGADLTFYIPKTGNYRITFNPETLEYAILRSYESNETAMYACGTFNDWKANPFSQMSLSADYQWQIENIYLQTGNYEMKFANTTDWSGNDWGGSEGTSGTATETTGGGSNIKFEITESALYAITFNEQTLEYAIQRTGSTPVQEITQTECRIYPNPANDQLHIITPNDESELHITTLSGQSILKQRLTQKQTTISLSGIPAGIYMVRLLSDEGCTTMKLLKE